MSLHKGEGLKAHVDRMLGELFCQGVVPFSQQSHLTLQLFLLGLKVLDCRQHCSLLALQTNPQCALLIWEEALSTHGQDLQEAAHP